MIPLFLPSEPSLIKYLSKGQKVKDDRNNYPNFITKHNQNSFKITNHLENALFVKDTNLLWANDKKFPEKVVNLAYKHLITSSSPIEDVIFFLEKEINMDIDSCIRIISLRFDSLFHNNYLMKYTSKRTLDNKFYRFNNLMNDFFSLISRSSYQDISNLNIEYGKIFDPSQQNQFYILEINEKLSRILLHEDSTRFYNPIYGNEAFRNYKKFYINFLEFQLYYFLSKKVEKYNVFIIGQEIVKVIYKDFQISLDPIYCNKCNKNGIYNQWIPAATKMEYRSKTTSYQVPVSQDRFGNVTYKTVEQERMNPYVVDIPAHYANIICPFCKGKIFIKIKNFDLLKQKINDLK
jgi:hypothetical protein